MAENPIDKVINRQTKLLNPEEASKILRVSVNTLKSWRCTGKENVPYIKIGSKVLYPEEDLFDWLQKKKVA